jgi:hypothetical protein
MRYFERSQPGISDGFDDIQGCHGQIREHQ